MKLFIISPKAGEKFVHKADSRFYYFNDGKGNVDTKATFYFTTCNQIILKHKNEKSCVYYQRFGNLPFRELKQNLPEIVWSKKSLQNHKEIPLCPKCFPNGEKDI